MLGSGVGLEDLAVTCRDWEELEGSGEKCGEGWPRGLGKKWEL